MAKPDTRSPLVPHPILRVTFFLVLYLTALLSVSLLDLSLYTRYTAIFIATIILVIVLRGLVDRRTILSLGWHWKGNERHFYTGIALAIAMLGGGTLILAALGEIEWMDYQFIGIDLALAIGLMVMVAISEELVFRGYILTNLLENMKPFLSLLVSAFLFAIFHSGNPGANWLTTLNIFLAGVLLGLNFIYTRNLWFGIAFHFAWNFLQGPVLGYEVSGLELNSMLIHSSSGNQLLTGGNFGFEGSLINTILSSIAILTLGTVYHFQKSTKG